MNIIKKLSLLLILLANSICAIAACIVEDPRIINFGSDFPPISFTPVNLIMAMPTDVSSGLIFDCRSNSNRDQVTTAYFNLNSALAAKTRPGAGGKGKIFFILSEQPNYDVYIAFSLTTLRKSQGDTINISIEGPSTRIFPNPGENNITSRSLGVQLVDAEIQIVFKNDKRFYWNQQIDIPQTILGSITYDHHTEVLTSNYILGRISFTMQSETCKFTSKSVALDPITPNQLAKGDEYGRSNFPITVTCPTYPLGDIYVLISDSNAQADSSIQGLLVNTGTAQNVGIKLYNENNTPVIIKKSSELTEKDFDLPFINGTPQVLTMYPNSVSLGRLNGTSASGNFYAVYKKINTSKPITPGTVKAQARIDVFYP